MITVQTSDKRQVVDITEQVAAQVAEKGDGLVTVFARHTTTAVTVADLDPGTDKDILDALAAMTPQKSWRHPHDPAHFPDHLWSSLIGPSLTLPVHGGKLSLGSWQRLVLIELDGPRERQLEITCLA